MTRKRLSRHEAFQPKLFCYEQISTAKTLTLHAQRSRHLFRTIEDLNRLGVDFYSALGSSFDQPTTIIDIFSSRLAERLP
jgi:hypothetical protein